MAFSNRKRVSLSSKRRNEINGGGNIHGGMGLRSMSEESLSKLTDCIQNMNEDVTKLYMECPETDFCEDDPKLFNLLNHYFITSEEITKLCQSLRTCLDSTTAQNYDLKSFNEFYIFGNDNEEDDLVKKSLDCRDEIVDMIFELEKMIKHIEKNLKRVRRIRAFITVALIVPAIGLLAAKLIPIGPIQALTSCIVTTWKKSTEVLKMKKIVMVSMDRCMKVALHEVDIIVKLLKRLRNVERLILETAAEEEKRSSSSSSSSPVAEMMEKEKEMMKSTIVDLDRETLRCDGLSQFGRSVARKKIVEFLSPSERDKNYIIL